MKYQFRPLGAWTEGNTPRDERRSRYTFKARWDNTLVLLERELGYLEATNVVIQADFREQDLRLDGMPRSGAPSPVHPGVRIAFGSIHGPLTYATDSCEFWQHNVRSIALGLEALRAVDRYGVTRRGEQYRGWRQIEASNGKPTSRQAAEALLAFYGGVSAALRATHPDAGGTAEEFDRVIAARDLLQGAR